MVRMVRMVRSSGWMKICQLSVTVPHLKPNNLTAMSSISESISQEYSRIAGRYRCMAMGIAPPPNPIIRPMGVGSTEPVDPMEAVAFS